MNPGEDIDHDGIVWDVADSNGIDDDSNGYPDDLIGWNFRDSIGTLDDNNPIPDLRDPLAAHGTIMASIAAETNDDTSPEDTSIAGMIQKCKIVPLRIGDLYAFIRALYYVATMHFDVANMSTVGAQGYNVDFHNAIKAAYDAGVVLVGGSWEHEYWIPTWPGSFDEVIQASAVDECGKFIPKCGYSDSVDVCGIGGSSTVKSVIITGYGYLYSPNYPGSQKPHVYWNHKGSSSYSAAQVSALAGLLRSVYPNSSPAFIRHEIL